MPRGQGHVGRNSTVSLAASTPIRYHGGQPCRAYIDGADARDEKGRTLWLVYWLVDGKAKEYIKAEPMEWRQASLLCSALNRRSGILDGLGEQVSA